MRRLFGIFLPLLLLPRPALADLASPSLSLLKPRVNPAVARWGGESLTYFSGSRVMAGANQSHSYQVGVREIQPWGYLTLETEQAQPKLLAQNQVWLRWHRNQASLGIGNEDLSASASLGDESFSPLQSTWSQVGVAMHIGPLYLGALTGNFSGIGQANGRGLAFYWPHAFKLEGFQLERLNEQMQKQLETHWIAEFKLGNFVFAWDNGTKVSWFSGLAESREFALSYEPPGHGWMWRMGTLDEPNNPNYVSGWRLGLGYLW